MLKYLQTACYGLSAYQIIGKYLQTIWKQISVTYLQFLMYLHACTT